MSLQKLYLIPFLIIAIKCAAQESTKRNFGFFTGMTINNVYDHEFNAKFDWKFSPVLMGGYLENQLIDRFAIGVELVYVHKGPAKHRINYLIASFPLKYILVKKWSLEAIYAPYVGYLFDYWLDEVKFQANFVKDIDFGFQSGIQYNINLNNKNKIFISPRFELGLRQFSFSKHLSLQLRIGYEF